jgi:hypothetical protein
MGGHPRVCAGRLKPITNSKDLIFRSGLFLFLYDTAHVSFRKMSKQASLSFRKMSKQGVVSFRKMLYYKKILEAVQTDETIFNE